MKLHPPFDRYDRINEEQLRRELELFLNDLDRRARPRFRINFLTPNTAAFTITNAPAAVTELGGVQRFRTLADLRGISFAEIFTIVTAAGFAGTTLGLQYTTDLTGATGWDYIDGGTGPSVPLDATDLVQSGRFRITRAAQAPVALRLVTAGGNATADPAIGLTTVEFSG